MEPSDSQAVADGFASAAGSFGAAQDFSDYMGALAVPEAYAVSPCDGFDGRPLEQLDVRRMTAMVKLLAIYGLGLVERSSFVACTGDVDGTLSAPGMLVHKPNGEAVTFASDAQAIRSPYYSSATRWAATATRSGGEELALLQLVYRDPLPELVRLRHRRRHRQHQCLSATVSFVQLGQARRGRRRCGGRRPDADSVSDARTLRGPDRRRCHGTPGAQRERVAAGALQVRQAALAGACAMRGGARWTALEFADVCEAIAAELRGELRLGRSLPPNA